jgi:hypothetical protein
LDDRCSADLFTENVADADDENVADADDVLKLRAPPAGKLGFKGKRVNNKKLTLRQEGR